MFDVTSLPSTRMSNVAAAVFGTLDFSSARMELFERLVFCKGQLVTEYEFAPVTEDQARTTLLSELAFQILCFLWKESVYVDLVDLPANVKKFSKNGRMSQFGTARKLATTVDEVSRLNSAVRNVAIAGYLYGLIGRRVFDKTHVEIWGTETLNDFMIEYHGEFFRIVSSLSSGLDDSRGGHEGGDL